MGGKRSGMYFHRSGKFTPPGGKEIKVYQLHREGKNADPEKPKVRLQYQKSK